VVVTDAGQPRTTVKDGGGPDETETRAGSTRSGTNLRLNSENILRA